jgi:hypothetical protein
MPVITQFVDEPWLARELKPNRELVRDHLSFILHGALVGAGPLVAHNTVPCLATDNIQCAKKFPKGRSSTIKFWS